MKNIHFTLIIFSFCLGLIFMSCGDDSTVTPTTPPGTVLFSKDSISVWLLPGGFQEGTDSVYFSTQNSGGVSIEFTLQSNADSTDHAIGYYGIYTNATPAIPYFPYIYFPVNEPFSTNLNFSTGTTYFSFSVRLTVNNSTTAHYVRLINIKVTKE